MIGSTTALTQTSQFNSNVVVFNARGIMQTAKPNAITNIDLKMIDDVEFTGGTLNVKGALFGDYLDMQVVDVDQMLKGQQVAGAPTGYTYDMVPGYPVLRQFVTAYYVNDQSTRQESFDLTYPAKVIAGLYLRIVYHSTNTAMMAVSPQIGMNYFLHTLLS
jgi:hypothetical protein